MNSSSHTKSLMVAVSLGVVLGAALVAVLFSIFGPTSFKDDQAMAEDQPLYWVAPMDDNYRRDEPGKSPMGMDLVPVYKKVPNEINQDAGSIYISPDVVNNLGVRTERVKRNVLTSEIVTVGYVQYDEDKLIHIHPRVSGWVEKLYVTSTGHPVKKGEPLYSLYSPELVNAQEEFILALNRKNPRFIEASENRLRVLKISDSFIETLKKDRVVKQTVSFYAPQSGVVDMLNIRDGFYVEPDTTMLSIGSLDQVWVEAEIFERQASFVKTNDAVTMTLDYLPGRVWTGTIDYIYPTLDSKTRTLRVRLRFMNKDEALKPNMFAKIIVHSSSADEVLVIPREALIRTGKQDRVVLAMGEGQFTSLQVKVGRIEGHQVEIVHGLNESDSVVTSAQFLLDSESNKTSDLTRLGHADDSGDDMLPPEMISE